MASKDNLELGLQIALSRFEDEHKRREALDTKASIVIGFTGALVSIILNVESQKPRPLPPSPYLPFLHLLLTAGLVSAILAGIVALFALWSRRYLSGPGDQILIHGVEELSNQKFRIRIIQSYAKAYSWNSKQNQEKVRVIGTALGLLVISSGFIAAVVFMDTWLIGR